MRFLKFVNDEKERKETLKKIKKKDEISENSNKKIIIILAIGILISIIFGIVFYKYNPVKSVKNIAGINYLTNYTYDIFVKNSPYLHTFISIFPIGLFIGIYYIFKEETKHFNFFSITVLVSILELIVLLLNLKIVFLPNYILALGFNLLQIFITIYIFSNLEERFFSLVKASYISLIGLVLLMFMPFDKSLNQTCKDLAYITFVLESFIVLNYSDKRFWRLGSWVFSIICFAETIGYLIVNFV